MHYQSHSSTSKQYIITVMFWRIIKAFSPIIGLVSYRCQYKYFSYKSVSVFDHSQYWLIELLAKYLSKGIRVEPCTETLVSPLSITENLLTWITWWKQNYMKYFTLNLTNVSKVSCFIHAVVVLKAEKRWKTSIQITCAITSRLSFQKIIRN